MTTSLLQLPYGVEDDNMAAFTEWVKRNGYRYSGRGRCLHWIARRRCAEGWCHENRNNHHWMDHVTGWTKDGNPALLLCQPYHLWKGDIQDIAAVADRYRLGVEVHGRGWYGAGTVAIELRPGKQQ